MARAETCVRAIHDATDGLAGQTAIETLCGILLIAIMACIVIGLARRWG